MELLFLFQNLHQLYLLLQSFNGGNDLVISGIDIDNDEIAVVAVDGATGDEIWTFEQSGTEVSSPAVYEDGSSRKIFVSVYDLSLIHI